MPTWSEVQKEINTMPVSREMPKPGPVDIVRRKYLKKLSEKTNRNVIAYYSGFLQRQESVMQSSIFDGDVNAFMNAIHGLDLSKGLDLILHTPGGVVTATEAIVDYLHSIFGNDIRCFVPQLAMSGGTMIACSCRCIFMGKQSSIGPIDPQFGFIPAYGMIEEYERAVQEIAKNPACVPLWQTIFNKVNPSFITECQHAIELSSELVTRWLVSYMFENLKKAHRKANKVVQALNNHSTTKTHGRHINVDGAIKIGLNIERLEKDNELQELVLTVHHAFMETFNQTTACKIVENQNGVATFINVGCAK